MNADIVLGVVLIIPYGVLADRWGRKPVLLLGLLGYCLGEVWVRVVCMHAFRPETRSFT